MKWFLNWILPALQSSLEKGYISLVFHFNLNTICTSDKIHLNRKTTSNSLVVKNYRDIWKKLWIVYENLSSNKCWYLSWIRRLFIYGIFYKSYKHKIATYICILMHYLTHLHNDLHAIRPLTITWYSSWYFITWHSSIIHYLQFLY